MPSSSSPDRQRRHALAALLALPGLAAPTVVRAGDAVVVDALRVGGVVAAFRHALAPGTFDPPGFTLGDCSTQRNLSDEGRAQSRRLGAWFRDRGLEPAAVRSSPWCRCVDTARLAFGRADVWHALGSPHGADGALRAARQRELRAALAAVPAGRFEVWVTHQFVLNDLVATPTASAEGLLLRADAGGSPQVLARLALA